VASAPLSLTMQGITDESFGCAQDNEFVTCFLEPETWPFGKLMMTELGIF